MSGGMKRTEYRVGAGTKDIRCECCGNVGKLVEVYTLVTSDDGTNRKEDERLVIPKNKERLEPVPVCQVCRKPIFDLKGYRCYYCKSWLCSEHAKMHFAEHDIHFPHQKIPDLK